MDRRTTVALVLCMLVFALITALQARFTPKPKLKPPVAATAPAAGLDTAFRAAPGAPATPATTAAGSPIPAAKTVRSRESRSGNVMIHEAGGWRAVSKTSPRASRQKL